MKKTACFAIAVAAICMATGLSACTEEKNWGESASMGYTKSLSKSLIIFDEQEFSPDNAYATVYFGSSFLDDPRVWEAHIDAYSYAFFIGESTEDFVRDMGYFWREYDTGVSIFDEIISRPFEEMSTVSALSKPVCVVHGERGKEGYVSNKYGLDETYNKETGELLTLKFLYSKHVKLPEDLFEEEGELAFIYSVPMGMGDSNGDRWFNGGAGDQETVNVHYEKKDGMVKLDQKVVYDRKMFSNVKFLDLEEQS